MLDRRLRRHLLPANDPGTAQKLLNKTENRGKALPLWDGDWPRRFFYTGRDLNFQKIQRTLAQSQLDRLLYRATVLKKSPQSIAGRGLL